MCADPDPRLFGRDDLVRDLADRLDGLPARGFVVGLLGEPGIGKSALAGRVVEHAREAGFTVLDARASQAEAPLPFAGLHQLLQPLLPRVDGLPARQRDALLTCFAMGDSAEANPFFTYLAVLELLVEAAAGAPVLVVVDDLHWLDQPSADALGFVARRVAGERVAVLGTARPGGPRFGDDGTATWIEVTGLDDAAASALLRARAPRLDPALRARVIAQAGGNPLAVLEFAAALESGASGPPAPDEDLPMTQRLERAFVARADGLAPDTRAILDVAALDDGDSIGNVLAATRILHPAPVDLGTAQPAVDRGLLSVVGETFRISHPLIGSALRQAMPPATRRRVHAALGRALTAAPDRAIWHRARSAPGPDEPIATELERAAIEARRRGAASTAFGWLERAAALSPDPHARAARLLSAAEIGYELGRFAQVEEIKATLTGMPLHARDRSRLTWLEGAFHDGATSEPAEIGHLVDLAQDAGPDDPDLAMQLLIGAGRRVWWRDPGPAVRGAIVRAARSIALPAHDPRLLAVLGLAESLELTPVIADGLTRWPVEADHRPDLAGLLGIAAFCIGDFGRAATFLSAPIREPRTQGLLSLLTEALAIRGWAEINLGIFDASGRPTRPCDSGTRPVRPYGPPPRASPWP